MRRILSPLIACGVVLLAAAVVRAQGLPREPLDDSVEVIRDLAFGEAGGRPLRLDLYRPEEARARPVPAVVLIHGGGWSKGDKSSVFGAAALVDRGFIVVSVNYRLSGEAPFPAPVEDCKCAVRWLRAHAEKYGVDPERIGVWGSSAGGQIALMVAYADENAQMEGTGGWQDRSSRVQAVCSWFGPTDMRLVEQPLPQYLGGTLRQVPERYARASPVLYVSADDPPTFLAHGDRDPVVPVEHSQTLHRLLKEAGVESRLLVVENASHGFRPTGGSAALGRKEIEALSVEFFERCLRAERK